MKDISEKEEEELLDQESPDEEDFFDSDEGDQDDFEMSVPEDADVSFDADEPGTAEGALIEEGPEKVINAGGREPAEYREEGFYGGAFTEEDEGIDVFMPRRPDEEDEGIDVFMPGRTDDDGEKEAKDRPAGILNRFAKMAPVTRAAVIAAVCAICALVVFGIIAAVMRSGKDEPEQTAAEDPEEQVVLVEQKVSEVQFLSFGPLSAENEEGYVSVKEFSQIIDKLYADGYVLVDIYSIGQTDENGKMVLNSTIDVPEGKKPLVIMQRDVSYPISRQTEAFAKRLVVDSDGFLRTEYAESDSESSLGDLDLIPLTESFIREHPDFSYNGARGIIGLTGYNGILGYRTSKYLASEADNPYGTFDTDTQTQAMEGVLDTLKDCGWRFASNGFGYRISYGSEYSLVEEDASMWKDQVGSLIGGTDIMIFPRQTDIGSWAPYDENNTKYTLLRDLGFRIYLAAEDETPGFMLARNEYLRIAVTEINSFSEFEAAFSEETEEDTAA